jgi:hypothetical protein
VLNHLDSEAHVNTGPGVDLITGEKVLPQGLRLPPYGVAVIAD